MDKHSAISLRVCLWCSLVVCLCCAPAAASEIPWKTEEYLHVANSQSLADVLRIFGADQGISMVISEKVTGNVSGKFGPMPPADFLAQMTGLNGLIWYYDGQSVYVYRSDEASSRIVRLQSAETESVLSTLKSLGIDGGRFPIKLLPDARSLYLAGPPRFLELVSQMAETLDEGAAAPVDTAMGIAVYPLKYAWADDHTVTFRDQQVIVPGMATMLQNLLAGTPAPQPSVVPAFRPLPQTLGKLKGQGLISVGRVAGEPDATQTKESDPNFIRLQNARGQAGQDQSGPAEPPGDVPQQGASALPAGALVQADRRLNAVIIRDTRDKLPAYEQAIEALDRPVGLVEITAAIIDINADAGFDWGPPYLTQWRHDGRDHQADFRLNALQPDGSTTFSVTLSRNKVTEFMQQIEALETRGLANIQSRPSVLTIDNIEAMLSRVQTFYVRVEGAYEVDLFNVSAGTSLKVTPHIIDGEADGTRKIKLLVDLQDGTVEDQTVDGIPRVMQNSINTQAVLREEESLLVGGLISETTTKVEKGLPFISRTPLIGFLFKSIDNKTTRNERVILLTPRIVDIDRLCATPLPAGLRTPPTGPEEVPPGPAAAPGSTLLPVPDATDTSRDPRWKQAIIPAHYQAPSSTGTGAGRPAAPQSSRPQVPGLSTMFQHPPSRPNAETGARASGPQDKTADAWATNLLPRRKKEAKTQPPAARAERAPSAAVQGVEVRVSDGDN